MSIKLTEVLHGPIRPDDEFADLIGFKQDLFDGYLFANAHEVVVSSVTSLKPRQGHFKRFIDNLLDKGYTVKVPTPLPGMRAFLAKNDFVQTTEHENDFFFMEVEVWVKKPKTLKQS